MNGFGSAIMSLWWLSWFNKTCPYINVAINLTVLSETMAVGSYRIVVTPIVFRTGSLQGGITATYEYKISGNEQHTDVQLNAQCNVSGLWRVIHPLIRLLLKRSDNGHLVQLKNSLESR